jgi:hypothetical protein
MTCWFLKKNEDQEKHYSQCSNKCVSWQDAFAEKVEKASWVGSEET